MSYKKVVHELQAQADPKKAKVFLSFFKTGIGQYGEGDQFIGITVPKQRKIAEKFKDMSLADVSNLLKQKIHEYRFTALEILVMKFEQYMKIRDEKECGNIMDFYLKHSQWINNWDLVDSSASYILGCYLYDYKKDPKVLYALARSKNIWERRIAIVSTHYFIRHDDFEHTLAISKILLSDTHDLIHKAVGWMLREVGKRDEHVLSSFLEKNIKNMPRTTLRYAIERYGVQQRKKYLSMI